MIKEWELLESRVDRDYRVFRIQSQLAVSPRTQKVGTFYTIDTRDWVNVIPVTPDGRIVMIKQYRHGSKEVTLEIPGGLVDEEDPREAAQRELLEETGYAGDRVELLGFVNPNPAIFNNRCHTYLIENVREISEKALDPNEDIEVVLMSADEIPSIIADGGINHSLVIVAFHFYFMKKFCSP
ncbi:MAG: ADP-ribose pyrophosphatase [Syntrophorhabdus sp. PtaB.Bin184]|jgi:8-oxo-dGTP pyrophosphatase MutT (NUDIX family)|nr:MAG: ADP-ribose pyrophosphatase [Syntrophorhabdus sp. PtaB.Bin184]